MPGSKCFYTREMRYRGYDATFKLNWPSVGSPWRAEQRVVIQSKDFGFILIQPVEKGVTLNTLLEVFEASVIAIVDERHLGSV